MGLLGGRRLANRTTEWLGFIIGAALSFACSSAKQSNQTTTHDGVPDAQGSIPPGAGGTGGSNATSPGTGGTASGGASVGGSGGTLMHDAGDGRGGTASGGATTDSGVPPKPPKSAVVHMLHRVTPDDDSYLTQANNGGTAAKSWLGAHWQSFEGFSGGPTAPATQWLGGGLLYFDTTAVNTGSNPPAEHLLDRQGTNTPCYNPWGGNPNPQVTWNITSETTRQYLIGQMKQALAGGAWSGLWLDDVNLDIGSSCVGPNDETWYTEFGSGWADTWANAVATFMEEIRAAFPSRTLLENAPWFSRGSARWTDPYVVRQLKTATLSNREGGVLDNGLTTGSGYWSVKSLFDYVDAVHAAGAGMVWDSFPSKLSEQEYALAAYFIGYTDGDFYGDASARQPSSWPPLYDVDLGKPLGARAFDGNARFTRVFEKGTVVLDVSAKTGSIPGF